MRIGNLFDRERTYLIDPAATTNVFVKRDACAVRDMWAIALWFKLVRSTFTL